MTTPEMRPATVPPSVLSQPASLPDRFSPMGRILLDRGPGGKRPRIRNPQPVVQGGLTSARLFSLTIYNGQAGKPGRRCHVLIRVAWEPVSPTQADRMKKVSETKKITLAGG